MSMKPLFSAALLAVMLCGTASAQTISGNTIRAGTTPLTAVVTQPANTLVGNCTSGTASPTACTTSAAKMSLSLTASDVSGAEATANKDAASGYAGLTSGILLKLSEFPAIGGGDVSCAAGGATCAVANAAISNAKLANEAANTIKGNNTGSAAAPSDLTASQAKTLLAIAASDVSGAEATANKDAASGYAGLTAGSLLKTAEFPALTGDVTTSSGAVATTIAPASVTLAKMANLAANSLLGNNTGSPATPIALTATQATAALNLFTSSLQGLAPSSGGGTTNFLRADGTWTTPAGGGTVTSVGLSSPSGTLSVGSTPVTASGTITADVVYGSSASTSAQGNDTRFPASVTGLRKGAGAGSSDTAATANTDYLAVASPVYTGTASGPNLTVNGNAAASVPAVVISGNPFAGTGTTSFPLVYVNQSGATASTTLNTAGTFLGVNANGGTSDFINFLLSGASKFKVSSAGNVTAASINGTNITAANLLSVSAGANIIGAAINLNASSNFAVNIGTGTTTSTVTVGNAANALALNAPTTLAAGTTALTPFKMTNGTLNTTAVAGGVEYDGTNFYGTSAGPARAAFVRVGDVGAQASSQLSFQPGLMTSVLATKGVFSKLVKASSVDNIEGSAISFTCAVNPTITMYECGTDASCASPTTIGSVTITASGQAFDGTVSNAAIAAGHYVGWAVTAGTCTSLDLSATAQLHTT